MIKASDRLLSSICFDFFQASYLFSSTFKGLEVFIPNSSISRISQARYEPLLQYLDYAARYVPDNVAVLA